MNPQQAESLKRAAILLGAMLLPGVIAVYPQLLGDAPLDTRAMVRAFVAAIVGGVISRYSEGIYDGRRAATGNVIKGDVTPPQDTPEPPPAVFAPPITAASLRDLLEAVDVLQQWQRPVAPPPAAISHRPAQRVPVTEPSAITPVQQFDAAVKRSHHAAKLPVVPLETLSDH